MVLQVYFLILNNKSGEMCVNKMAKTLPNY